MRQLFQLLITLAVLSGGLAVLPAAEHRFAGEWKARYKNTVICTIRIDEGEKITGATQGCSIHVDESGDLVEAEPAPGEETQMLNPSANGDTLSFGLKDEDDTTPMKFDFVLTGAGKAELRFLDAPVTIKPIRFVRE